MCRQTNQSSWPFFFLWESQNKPTNLQTPYEKTLFESRPICRLSAPPEINRKGFFTKPHFWNLCYNLTRFNQHHCEWPDPQLLRQTLLIEPCEKKKKKSVRALHSSMHTVRLILMRSCDLFLKEKPNLSIKAFGVQYLILSISSEFPKQLDTLCTIYLSRPTVVILLLFLSRTISCLKDPD